MNGNTDNILILVHRLDAAGGIASTQYEEDFQTHQLVSTTPIAGDSIVLDPGCDWNFTSDNKLNLNYHYVEPDDSSITVIKLGGIEDLNPMNYATEFTTVLSDSAECKQFASNSPEVRSKKESKIPNIPTMIRCQNCDTNFPTKYQYQRHQCEFNAEKVVLKADADMKDLDKGVRIKYDCPTCGKQFVSKNNLERHQTSHDTTKRNVCDHCNKHFVSENRLRIHKENHCKKAGDISKFYRSDVAVWKCLVCNQVFATPTSANNHANICALATAKSIKADLDDASAHVDKVLTELLLQCEFCNRTYAEKPQLSAHQRTHTTAVNYECVTCKETFSAYTAAAKHWMVKCSDEANLFYLPKLTYCEFCDRTFKSHELLYAHKIKKKHYTPKVHPEKDAETKETVDAAVEKTEEQVEEQEKDDAPLPEEKKDAIVKLIEDVLTTLSTSLDNMDKKAAAEEAEENKENIEQTDCVLMGLEGADDGDKKKRGRKRKTGKQAAKTTKKVCAAIEKGYKYQCEKCVKVWDSVGDLEEHREKEHASSYTCEQCQQVLHSAKALIIHSRAHQSLKPYVCETCGRSYSQTSHLWQHMRFHQGIKPFACPHEGCEARYTIRPDLKDHIRKVHTRERPFKCTVCNKCFLTGSVYYQHRLIHTNDRRYGCDICQKRFFRADALNNHRRIHTDERPYPCEICGREFRQKGDRNKHVRTQHPEC